MALRLLVLRNWRWSLVKSRYQNWLMNIPTASQSISRFAHNAATLEESKNQAGVRRFNQNAEWQAGGQYAGDKKQHVESPSGKDTQLGGLRGKRDKGLSCCQPLTVPLEKTALVSLSAAFLPNLALYPNVPLYLACHRGATCKASPRNSCGFYPCGLIFQHRQRVIIFLGLEGAGLIAAGAGGMARAMVIGGALKPAVSGSAHGDTVGEDAARRMVEKFAGINLAIPNLKMVIWSHNKDAIRQEFDQMTMLGGLSSPAAVFELGVKYRVCARTVEKLLKTQ